MAPEWHFGIALWPFFVRPFLSFTTIDVEHKDESIKPQTSHTIKHERQKIETSNKDLMFAY